MIDIKQLKEQVILGHRIDKKEALDLYQHPDSELLYLCADQIRKHFTGEKLDTCSILNASSGICSEDCAWCSQALRHKTGVPQYNIVSNSDAVDAARINHSHGVHRFSLVTASRAFPKEKVATACQMYQQITKETNSELSLCASMGLLDFERLKMLKDAGVGYYHINIETSPSYFPKLVKRHTFEDKLNTIAQAKKAGLKICSGGIIGMGESSEDRIDMALEIARLEVKSIPINILNPIPGTPLEHTEPISKEDVLRTIAVFRFANPDSYMRFAGGRLLISDIVEKAFSSGMNALMVGDMLTTVGSKVEQDMEMITRLGFTKNYE